MATVKKEKKSPRELTMLEAGLLLLVFIAILILNAKVWGMGTAMGIMYCAVIAIAYGILVLHWGWSDLFDSVLKVTNNAMPVMFILFMCGVLQAAWLMSGTVPYFIWVGLKLLSPKIYLLISFLVCFVIGVVTGNGWATISTIGLALVSVGNALGVPIAYSCAAVVAGAMNGDRFSPLVDTFNLCAATSGANVIKQWSSMWINTIIGFVCSCVLFFIIGLRLNINDAADMSNVTTLINDLATSYNFNILLLLPLVVVVVLIILKVDAVPAFFISSIVGLLEGCIFQNVNFFEGSAMLWNGYVANTVNAELNSLLSAGGLMTNAGLIMLLFVAFVFAGALNKLGVLRVLLQKIVPKIKSTGSLVLACTLTGLAGVFISTSVFVSVILNSEIYKEPFRKKGLAPEVLGRTLVEGCAFASCYVPWSGGGILVTASLLGGVWTWAWLPLCFCGWIPTVVNIVLAYLGINNAKAEYDEDLNLIESVAK